MKQTRLALALGLVALATLNAQGARVGVSLGLAWSGYREGTYSSILQRMETPRLGLDLDFQGPSFLHHLSLGFTMGRTHSAVSNTATISRYYDEYTGQPVVVALASPIVALKAHLSYGLAGLVAQSGGYQGFAGGVLRMDALVQIANYPSVSAIISLAGQYRQRIALDSNMRFSVDVSTPLLAYAVRPPYAGADAALMQMAARNPLSLFATGRLLSLGRNQGLLVDARFQHVVTSGIEIEQRLSAALTRVAFPLPRVDAELCVSSGVALAW